MLACHTVRLNQCLRPVRPCAVAVAAASPATPAVGRPMLLVLVSQFSCEESEMCSEIQHVKVCSIPLGPLGRCSSPCPRHASAFSEVPGSASPEVAGASHPGYGVSLSRSPAPHHRCSRRRQGPRPSFSHGSSSTCRRAGPLPNLPNPNRWRNLLSSS